MAGISEDKAMAAKRQGEALARHRGAKPGSERYNAIKYGTARAKGWYPSRETGKHRRPVGIREVMRRRTKKKR